MKKELIKYIALALIAVLTVFCIASCDGSDTTDTETTGGSSTQAPVSTGAVTTAAPDGDTTTEAPTPAVTFPETGDLWSKNY